MRVYPLKSAESSLQRVKYELVLCSVHRHSRTPAKLPVVNSSDILQIMERIAALPESQQKHELELIIESERGRLREGMRRRGESYRE